MTPTELPSSNSYRRRKLMKSWVAALLMGSCLAGGRAATPASQLLVQPEKLNDEEIRAYVSQFGTVPNQHDAITALRENGSEQAGSILLALALDHKQFDRRWAASSYVAVLKEKRQATILLTTDDWEIQEIGLQGLRGQTVDGRLLDAIGPFFQSDRLQLRWTAAVIYEESPESSLAFEMAAQIIESLGSVDRSPDATRHIGYGLHQAWSPFQSDVTQIQLLGALARMKGLDLAQLRLLQPDSPDTARDAVYIARAKLGDREVKTELMRISREGHLPLVRIEAVRAFIIVGNVQDIPFLEEISRNDPFDVPWSAQDLEIFQRAGTHPPERKYPVRMTASEVMARITGQQYNPFK